jgi:hypothetical protein
VAVVVVSYLSILAEADSIAVIVATRAAKSPSLILYIARPPPFQTCAWWFPRRVSVQDGLQAVLHPARFGFKIDCGRLSIQGPSASVQLTPVLAGQLYRFIVCAEPIDIPLRLCIFFSLSYRNIQWRPREDNHFVVRSRGEVLVYLSSVK